MDDLEPKEKSILYCVWGIIICIFIFLGFMMTSEQWFGLLGVGFFIFILFLFFHFCDWLNKKYIKQSPAEQEVEKAIQAAMMAKSKKRILYYAERNNQSPEEINKLLERDTRFINENSFFLAAFQKVFASMRVSFAAGYFIGICSMLILGEANSPNSAGITPSMFYGLMSGSICFASLSLFFLIRFFIRVIKGMKESRENDIIIRR